MKHRLTIPRADDWLREHAAIHDFVERAGWVIRSQSVNQGPWRPKNVEATLVSRNWPSASIDVQTGAVLVYDDTDQSMGVTHLAEPRDTVPPEPEDARPLSFVEQ